MASSPSFILTLYLDELHISIDELVSDFANSVRRGAPSDPDLFIEEYHRLKRLAECHQSCLDGGLKEFSWDWLWREGLLCDHDLERFNLPYIAGSWQPGSD